jgi:hypothetical protein
MHPAGTTAFLMQGPTEPPTLVQSTCQKAGIPAFERPRPLPQDLETFVDSIWPLAAEQPDVVRWAREYAEAHHQPLAP